MAAEFKRAIAGPVNTRSILVAGNYRNAILTWVDEMRKSDNLSSTIQFIPIDLPWPYPSSHFSLSAYLNLLQIRQLHGVILALDEIHLKVTV
jgi:hypothetical protein